jgi:hypothetical protein
MLFALREGLRALRRSWGLTLLVLATNLGFAALLALPLVGLLERDLRTSDSASRMLYGFDHSFWSRWSEGHSGWPRAFEPAIFGPGFAFKNVDLLLKGELPLRLFARRAEDDEEAGGLDPVILGVAFVYLLLQTFLAGGILGVFRSQQGRWTLRGLLHGSGFYFGRLLRIAAIALAADYLIFRINGPIARYVDRLALEAATETTAMALTLSRHAALLMAILFVSMVSSYAKAIVVLEERSSALLAFLSSLSFCAAKLWKTAGHYLAIVALAVAALVVWNALDAAWTTVGYKTQLVTLLLAQALVLSRIALRLALMAGQLELYRSESARAPLAADL